MRVDAETKKFLLGESLSNGAFFPVDRSPLISRNPLLVELVRGKSVLHLGCADHTSLIRKKREQGNYLHDLLGASASSLVGADINGEALNEMKTLGIENLYQVDELPESAHYDLLVVPDVIEHVGNVADFLAGLKRFSFDAIVITTPNALRLRNRMLFSAELVNTDHRYWFSPYTLSKTIYESGFEIEEFYYTDTPMSWKSPVRSMLKYFYPLCRDGLAVVIRPS
tara:strand:+ start:405 stop:1079 length:675 start_codon:yes stop_codon:yes gene_type:complete